MDLCDFTRNEVDALWDLFSMVCARPEREVCAHIDSLKVIGEMLQLNDQEFFDFTGHYLNEEEICDAEAWGE